MIFTNYKYCLFLVSVFVTGSISLRTNALEVKSDRGTAFYVANSDKEYTFKAPDNKIISNPERLTRVEGYKVEVYGGTEELQQVKEIEPTAFIKGNIIQVGTFTQQVNAEDLVRKLAIQGLWARIVVQEE